MRTTRPAQHRALTESAVRNGMTAAAAAGGLLAVVVPTVAIASPSVQQPAAGSAVLQPVAGEESGPAARTAADDGLQMLASVVPVAERSEPEPPEVNVSDLLKAVGLADVARQAEEVQEAHQAAAHCDADLGGIGRVKPWVRSAAEVMSCLFDEPPLIGVSSRGRVSDHPSGLALDLMTSGKRGDRIAQYALDNQEELGVSYVIWKQRVNHGNGWERMEDRGSATENHFDHVHISFERRAPGKTLLPRVAELAEGLLPTQNRAQDQAQSQTQDQTQDQTQGKPLSSLLGQ